MKQKYLTLLLGIVVITTTIAAPFASSQTTVNTSVFTHDDSSIYVNWRDTSSGNNAYAFEVQRIRVTPLADTNLTATKTGPNSVSLSWKNATISTPYYAVIERSTLTNSSSRFNPATDNTLKSVSTAAYKPWVGSQLVAKSGWSYLDNTITSQTVNYYRIRECSEITPPYMRLSDGAVRLNTDSKFKPVPVCVTSYISTSIDMTPPPPPPPPPPAGGVVVVSVNPEPSATNVPTNTVIVATFSKKMNSVYVTASTFKIFNATGAPAGSLGTQISGTVSLDSTGFKATFTPSVLLTSSTIYNGSISKSVRDVNGNTLANDYLWAFVTAPSTTPPPPPPPPPPPAGGACDTLTATPASQLRVNLNWTDQRTDEDGVEITSNLPETMVFPPGPWTGDIPPPPDQNNTPVQPKPSGTGGTGNWSDGFPGGLTIGSKLTPNTLYNYELRPFYFNPLPCTYDAGGDPSNPPTSNTKCYSSYSKNYLCSVNVSAHTNWVVLATTTGSGGVSSQASGISCGSVGTSCNAEFPYPTSQKLTATPASGWAFDKWLVNGNPSSACPSSSLDCTVSYTDSAPTPCPGGQFGSCATGFNAVRVTTVFKPIAGPSVSITASPSPVLLLGQSATLIWDASNVSDCASTGSWWSFSSLGTSGSKTFIFDSPGSANFGISCTGPAGTATGNVTVNVLQPTGSMSASPCNLSGSATSCTTRVSWTSSNAVNPALYLWNWATSARGTLLSLGVANGFVDYPGVVSVPPGNSTVFVLDSNVVGAQGGITLSGVAVGAGGTPAAPTLTLTRFPIRVANGNSAKITWSTTGTNSCNASGDWDGIRPTSGYEFVTPEYGPDSFSAYTLSCSGAGGVVSKTVAVGVRGPNSPNDQSGLPGSQGDIASVSSMFRFVGTLSASVLDSIIGFFVDLFTPNSGPAPSPASNPVQDVAPAQNPALSPAPPSNNNNLLRLPTSTFSRAPASQNNPIPPLNFTGSLEPYYVTLSSGIKQPVILDKGLSPDVVYMYRVRIKYANGTVSAWSQPKASRTMSQVGVSRTSASAPVCTRNSYCAFSIKNLVNTRGEASEVQCRNNNDCGKVGKSRSSVQER